MKQILVIDDEGKRIGVIQFDGKQIVSDDSSLQELVDNSSYLPEEVSARFEALPWRFSYLSRVIFGGIENIE